MSDEDMELLPSKRLKVSARHIRQAFEHIQATGEREATFLIVSDVPIEGDLICAGVSTRRMLPPIEAKPVTRLTPTETHWTLSSLSETVILDVVTAQGPIDTRQVGDTLGVPGGNISLRQRIRRVLQSLQKTRKIRALGDKRYPKWAPVKNPTNPTMPVHPRGPRIITRQDITLDKVVAQLSNGPMTSRKIGDNLGIPRHDNLVRSKITEHVRTLTKDGRAQVINAEDKGERIYELIDDSHAATA